MRIAMVAACPFPSPQGSQVLVRQLCARLVARGHDVELLTYGQGSALQSQGYQHHRIRRLPGDDAARSGPTPVKPMLDALMVGRLGRMLSEGGSAPFDVVHCHNYEGALVGLAARLRYGVPVLYHSHNLMADELPAYFGNRAARAAAARLGAALDAVVPYRADHAIALCDYTADVMRRGGVAEDRLS
ncbi:MAG: glycosyltransferase family 4 protein, partial [Candidatus Binatia bacterium]